MLTAADLNSEVNNILNNPISLISPTTGVINFNLQAHTNLLPSVLTASSGFAGSVLITSTAGTPVPQWSTGATAGGVFTASTAAVPTWSSAPNAGSVFITTTAGVPMWSSGSNPGSLFMATTSGFPTWSSGSVAGGVFIASLFAVPTWSSTSNAGSVFIATTAAQPQWSAAAPTGGVLVASTSSLPTWLGLGTSGQVLTAATSGAAAWQAAAGGNPPLMAVGGAVGTVTSAQTVTLSADRYLLITTAASPTGFLMTSTASYTIDVSSSVAGPIANGRDQASTFSSTGNWISLWCISTGSGSTAPAGLASRAAPPAFPTLPTSYSALAYVNTIYYSSAASPTFLNGYVRGAIQSYGGRQTALSIGASTALTNVDVSQFIPPNALADLIYATPRGSAAGFFTNLYLTSSAGSIAHAIVSAATGGGGTDQIGPLLTIPNVGQKLTYNVDATGQISLFVHGYTVPTQDV